VLNETTSVVNGAVNETTTDGPDPQPVGFFARLLQFFGDIVRWTINFLESIVRGFIELIFPNQSWFAAGPGTDPDLVV
jgi:hypothetical protein